ncbi:MAG: xanthine dehydrogenase family protein molybdopterin-binding subunit, partial [Steroidobacteraceae bacterium]
MAMHGLEEVAFLRSPVAHARLVAIRKPHGLERQVVLRGDMPEARDIEGNSGLPSYKHSAQPPLAQDKIRFVGEPIALAFAPTRAQAEDIAERVDIEFAELPAIPDVRTSREIAAHTRVHEHWEDNTFLTLHADKRFAELSAKASVVVRRHIDLSRQCMVPLEGKAVLAYWDERLDQLIVYSATQIPHLIRNGLSQVLGLDSAMVRVIAPDVGGGFGYKGMLHQEEVCIAWLAWKYRKPFRFVEDRREHLIVGANSRQHHYEMVGYADERGRLLALDARLAIDGGAYSVSPFTIGLEPGQALGNLPGPYAFEGYRCTVECLATNKPGFMPYRGVARTGVCFAMELLIDAIAREVGREPWEVRKENLVPAAAMPYVNVMNKHFDSGDYPASLQEVRGMIDFDGVRSRQRRERAGGQAASRRVGVGFATYTEQSAHGASVFATWGTPFVPGFDSATVRIMPDGSVEIRVGVQSHGQGMETTFAQIVHEILGVELARIKMVHGDTGLTPFSTGTYASRSLVMSGGAVSRACKTLVPRLKYIAAHLLQRSA